MDWLKGKKTYISAAALALLAVAGFCFGFLDNPQAVALLLVAAGFAGLGAKTERHQAEISAALDQLRAALDKKESPREAAQQLGRIATGAVVDEVLSSATNKGGVPHS